MTVESLSDERHLGSAVFCVLTAGAAVIDAVALIGFGVFNLWVVLRA